MSQEYMASEDLLKQPLAHYRTKNSKNGVRLYQNLDGSLTPLGRIHYGVGLGRDRSPGKGGAMSLIAGKKLVDKTGGLTKNGVKNVEETMKKGSYLNPSRKEKKGGHAAEREKVAAEFKKEHTAAVKDGMPKSEPSEKDKEIWDKYKDKYAEATLKDLKLPINEKNKGAVKDAMRRYDPDYEYGADKKDRDAVKDSRNKRFKEGQEKSEKEIKKEIEEKVENIGKDALEKRDERRQKVAEEKAQLKKNIAEIRTLADEELNKRIARLQKEKQYAELLNERSNWEKSPAYQYISNFIKNAAENFANKALNVATDELLRKYRDRMNAAKQANQNSGDKKPEGSTSTSSSSSSSSSSGGKFSKAEKGQIRSMANSGKSVADIAKSLGVPEDKVKSYMSAAGITIA